MPRWTEHLGGATETIEKAFDALTSRLRARVGTHRDLQVLPYIGYGTSQKLFLKGRVLESRQAAISGGEDIWNSILETYRRFNSNEVPQALIRAVYGDSAVEVKADDEGFFSCELPYDITPAGPGGTVQFELIEPAASKPITSLGSVLVPPPSAKFGIISDIDDTVMLTHATNLLRLVETVFLQNARQRIAFPGVAALYSALCGAETLNPIFYVSSGPWNLFDLILDFLELNSIPRGPILLQDYGFDRDKFFSRSHFEHKLQQITHILETYSDLPFVLFGDSGQRDPEIYADVLAQTSNRIRAVYIRDVAGPKRDAEVRLLAERARSHGGELLLVEDSLEAAKHAATLGLLTQDDVSSVAREVASEKADGNSLRDGPIV